MSTNTPDDTNNEGNNEDSPSNPVAAIGQEITNTSALTSADTHATLATSDVVKLQKWKEAQTRLLSEIDFIKNRLDVTSSYEWGSVVRCLNKDLLQRSLAVHALNLGCNHEARCFIKRVSDSFLQQGKYFDFLKTLGSSLPCGEDHVYSELGHSIPKFCRITAACNFGEEWNNNQVSPVAKALLQLSLTYQELVDPVVSTFEVYRLMGDTARAEAEEKKLEDWLCEDGKIRSLRAQYKLTETQSRPIILAAVRTFCEEYSSQLLSVEQLQQEVAALAETVQALVPPQA